MQVAEEPKVTEEDLDNLLFLSTLATIREKELMAQQDQLEEALFQNHRMETSHFQPMEGFAEVDEYRPFVLPRNVPRQIVDNVDKKRSFGERSKSRKQIPAEPDLTGLYAIATLLAQDDAAAMAM